MKIEKFRDISEIRGLWNDLYSGNELMSFFQAYAWNECLENNFNRKRLTYYSGCKLQYYVIDCAVIAPLIINKKKKQITLLGQDEPSDYLSFIFQRISKALLESILSELFLEFKGYSLLLHKINQHNPMYGILVELADEMPISIEQKDCVCINTRTDTATFYASLSKSVRQNYRTAKNRLKKDNHKYEINTMVSTVGISTADKLHDVYMGRRQDCDTRSPTKQLAAGIAKSLIREIGIEKPIDILTEYSLKAPVFLSEILIDEELAAFCEGEINNRADTISIARVAIKRDYYSYSPGQILLIETIEKVKDKITYFDLTRGSEDYKFKLGGKLHYNYRFTIKRK